MTVEPAAEIATELPSWSTDRPSGAVSFAVSVALDHPAAGLLNW